MSSFGLESAVGAFIGSVDFHWGPNEDEPTIIANKILRISEELDDMYEPMLAAREILVEDMETRFNKEVDLDYRPWPPRKQSTIDYYGRTHQTYSTILRKDDHLFEAATNRDNYQIYSDDLFVDTTQFPVYWHAHNVGSTVGRGVKLPKREFMGVSTVAADEIVDVFDDWIEGFLQVIRPGVTGIPMFRGAFGHIGGKIRMGAPRRPGVVWFGGKR